MKKLFLSVFVFMLCFLFPFSPPANALEAEETAGTVVTESGSLNVRSEPSVSSRILTSLKKGTNLTLHGKSSGWYKVQYAKEKYGYCHSDYIKPVAGAYEAIVNTRSTALNVRSGPGLDYRIKGSLPKDSSVTVIAESSGFCKIIYNGTEVGYASKDYLKAFAQQYEKTSLFVPSYKQTDSRWKNIPIGTTGGTIGTIGCTTTALAMTESYRTNTAVTPPIMKNRLSYTSSGSLYWPENYNASLADSSTVLQKTYSLLKSGKPVILGAKTREGKQHWVVVTGHTTESSLLLAKNFSVNDPGSKTRTTLAHFFEIYPYIYKIVHY